MYKWLKYLLEKKLLRNGNISSDSVSLEFDFQRNESYAFRG